MLRTTVVGGWPLPLRYAEELRRYYCGERSEHEAERALRGASALAIRQQKATGITRILGGEIFADPLVSQLPRRFTGIQAVRAAEGGAGPGRSVFYRLVGTLDAPRGLGYATAYQRQRELDPDLPKATCPGPLTLLSFLLLADPSALSAIPRAIEIIRREVTAIVKAGAREVEMQATAEVGAVCLLNLPPAEVAASIGKIFWGFKNVVRTVHLCPQGLSGSAMPAHERLRLLLPVIEALRRKVDRVHVEVTQPDLLPLLSKIPKEIEVIAGIADVSGEPQPVDILVCRGRDVLQCVPEDRLWLAPSCGLRSATPEQASGIVTNLVAAARRLP